MSSSISNNGTADSAANNTAQKKKVPVGVLVGVVSALIIMFVLTIWLMTVVADTVTAPLSGDETTTTNPDDSIVETITSQVEQEPAQLNEL